jgi:PleD family two-component response regulator
MDARDVPDGGTVTPTVLIARADERLYDAKQSGRNRVSG